jgi:hypothetical protein
VKLIYDVEKIPWALRVTLGNKIDINAGGVNTGKNTDLVESTEVKGVARSAYSDALDFEIQLMAGKKLDQVEADHLKEKLDSELKHRYEVRQKSRPGTKPNTVVVVYEAKLFPWIPERTRPEIGTYHQKQGISIFLDGTIYKGLTFGLGTDGDTLTERFKGYTMGFESRMLGTPRLGAKVRFDTFGVRWKSQTEELMALTPGIPGAYRSRQSIDPSIAIGISRNLYATVGANFTELEMMLPVEHWESAHEATASLTYHSPTLKQGTGTHAFSSGYEIRTATRTLDSDFVYTRHTWRGAYVGTFGHNKFKFSYLGGRLTGNAPLFVRYSLGNTATLRGWNKYDIDPVGGNRVFHLSTEWSYKYFGVFMDNGSIWTGGQDATNRSSFGVFLGPLKVGVPVGCSDNCGVTFLVRIE